ncbi:hypothetical protein MOOR_09200 [Moorella thermoacetica]|uniref:Uncharacterized protein n=1 Tax=Neomoorella thermoacetica TaxID=1525 RepID=A0A1J5JYB6_NEOTH|nr:hypothetical protein [Moorella thermoacetica]OIQ09535.1 hypothetical protein MOOR_09200 [Moorella thermoacetica]
MMNSNIGFDRRIKLDWLDATAWKAGTEGNVDEVRKYLNELLRTEYKNKEARRKTITVLTRIWVRVPDEHQVLQRRGLKILLESDPGTRLWLHWGMTLLAYPFFRDIAMIIGRLLTLQNEVSLQQISRRLSEQWGERSSVHRACQRVVRSMVDWSVLNDTSMKGVYVPAAKKKVSTEDVQLWFLEALLRSEPTPIMPLQQLLQIPSAFPFHLDISLLAIRQSKQLEIQRQGLDLDMVVIR